MSALPNHPRLLAAPRPGLTPLSVWLAGARAERREVSVRTAFKIGRDIAEALTFLHLVGLSAGQVDADAIFVDANGAQAYLRPLLPEGDAPAESAACRAPQRADLIELGVVLFELCCRRALRPREDLRHMRRGFALVSLNNPKVPAAGDALIAALLAPAPGRGYERAKQVLDELRVIVAECDGPPSVPTPATPTASVLGRRVDELLAGWAPRRPVSAPRPPSTSTSGSSPLRRLAGALSVVLALLWVFAPVPSSAAPSPAPVAASARPAVTKDRAALTRELIAIKQELMRTK